MADLEFDAITLEVLWSRLTTIADEMTTTLIRTAFSNVVNESHDCAGLLLDRDGHSLAQASSALPAFTGTMPVTVKAVIERFGPERLRDGDVLMTNDPWLAGGHLPDLTVVRPLFREGALIAFAASTAHLPDVGGRVWSADSTEIFEEGLRFPLVKLLDAGEPNRLLLDMIRMNVRLPDQVEHDIMAQVTATAIGARRLSELMDHYRLRDVRAIAKEILARSEGVMRSAIEAIPDGVYRHTVHADGFAERLTIVATLTVEGSRLSIDFAGSSRQQPWGINSVLHYTRAYTSYAVKCLIAPDVPNNEGTLRPLSISAPAGSILNATMPAAVGGRHLTTMFVPFAIFAALAQVMPDKVMAESGMPGSPYFFLHRRDRPTLAQSFFTNGGMGARSGKDGISACCFPPNISNVPVEIAEQRSRLFIECRELITDSGGPGRWRGGLGQRHVIHIPRDLDGHATVSILSDRTQHPAQGILGGQPGSLRRNIRNAHEELHPKRTTRMEAGDSLETRMPGGGGVGPPRERDPQRVRDDVLNGYVSETAAREIYGLTGAVVEDPFRRCAKDAEAPHE